jgi:hypothetical protein
MKITIRALAPSHMLIVTFLPWAKERRLTMVERPLWTTAGKHFLRGAWWFVSPLVTAMPFCELRCMAATLFRTLEHPVLSIQCSTQQHERR